MQIAIAMATSGIAATLLPNGRTAHSTIKLPLDLSKCEEAVCNISKGSATAKLLQKAVFIVWDECTMAHKLGLEALDKTLRDLRENDQLFGGLTLLLSGDFRQTLPIIPRGSKADELSACLKSSRLWSRVQPLKLTINMRVQQAQHEGAVEFSKDLLTLGNGQLQEDQNGKVNLPFGHRLSRLQELTEAIFPALAEAIPSPKWLAERAILAPRNDAVDVINKRLTEQFPGHETTYKSVDKVLKEQEAIHYPTEFLNSLQPTGFPPHALRLKVGMPVMLLRNLDPPQLCNGTRLVIKKLMPNIIEATIITGTYAGEEVLIPRISMSPTDFPFEFKRLQFPVKVCFAMTINKSQGQTLGTVGLDLSWECFSHGQLYVACSRVGNPENLYIYSPTDSTTNVVYKEVFNK